ncbi:peptidase A24A prepilin type IV [Xylanimonas cellulosilytica DSM 15894]|uniref:Peptidase A24A prepilin type IV n=1 Tax=Xylanimonas cellulosilytica (strain DSM 15894 / JCM 12276 / CECT 5975 / KCTC 9989 / LMG 20990 / NBRC 107835 / XIL07) TaxID=446471 RepID=D1BW37_XYLCX|nr:A24 family peptidase [Xylanimonas cellulosilytica]ACZ29540.1 peptidase A24A prepilin type IV [Xylanimonas cellulosilytica DSM 15894]
MSASGPTTARVLGRLATEVAPHRSAVLPLAVLALAWAGWASGPGWATPAYAVVGLAGAAHAVIDARTHRLPDAVTYPAVLLTAALLGLAAAATADGDRLVRALGGAAALGGAYLALHLVNRRGLGLGDVKLAVLLGLPAGWAGWDTVWWTGVLPFLLGGVWAVALLVTGRANRRTALAFGPFMLAGAALTLAVVRAEASLGG